MWQGRPWPGHPRLQEMSIAQRLGYTRGIRPSAAIRVEMQVNPHKGTLPGAIAEAVADALDRAQGPQGLERSGGGPTPVDLTGHVKRRRGSRA